MHIAIFGFTIVMTGLFTGRAFADDVALALPPQIVTAAPQCDFYLRGPSYGDSWATLRGSKLLATYVLPANYCTHGCVVNAVQIAAAMANRPRLADAQGQLNGLIAKFPKVLTISQAIRELKYFFESVRPDIPAKIEVKLTNLAEPDFAFQPRLDTIAMADLVPRDDQILIVFSGVFMDGKTDNETLGHCHIFRATNSPSVVDVMEPAFPFETVQLSAVGALEVHDPTLSAPVLRYCTKDRPQGFAHVFPVATVAITLPNTYSAQ